MAKKRKRKPGIGASQEGSTPGKGVAILLGGIVVLTMLGFPWMGSK